MKKYILLLGGSHDQLFIIKTAHEIGIGTVVVDANKNAPGFKLANYSSAIDFSNVSRVISFVEDIKDKGVNVCGVTTMGSDVPQIIAEIANYFKWAGPSKKTSILATNKYKMKCRLKEFNIPVPKFALINSANEIRKNWQKFNCNKVIIKPTDRAGSRGVRIISREEEIISAYENALRNSKIEEVILEEYIDGPQISTESILYDDKSCTPGFADRVYEGMEVFFPQIMENGGWVPSFVNNGTRDSTVSLVEKAARALGIKKGVAKGDVVIHPEKGPMIIEIAARLSGGDFSESLVPLGCGVNYVKAVIKIAIGEEPDWKELKPKFQENVANRYFFLPPGRLEEINGIDILKNIKGLEKFNIFYKVGENIPKIENHGQRVGVMVIRGRNRDLVQENIDYIYDNIQFKIKGTWYTGNPKHFTY